MNAPRSTPAGAPMVRNALARTGQGLALVLALAGPTRGADFTPPRGCTLHLTVQDRSCSVAQHYTCEGDPTGDQRVAYFDAQGLSSLSRIDAETRWIETVSGDVVDTLEPGGKDDSSLSTLIRTGRDDFDFWTVSDGGERLHFVGHDELTGETRVIDGVSLQATRFELKMSDDAGTLLLTRSGHQYISREHGRFYGGVETITDPEGKTESIDTTPVRFIRPGQPGFGSTEPQFGCNAQMAGGLNGGGA